MIGAGASDRPTPPGDDFGLTAARLAIPLPAGRASNLRLVINSQNAR